MGASLYFPAAAGAAVGAAVGATVGAAVGAVVGAAAGGLVAVGAAGTGVLVGAGGLVAVGGTGVAVGVAPQLARASAPPVTAARVKKLRLVNFVFLDMIRPPYLSSRALDTDRHALCVGGWSHT